MPRRFATLVLATVLVLWALPRSAAPAWAATAPLGDRFVATDAAPDFNVPAAQLRATLDRALAEHAFLLAEAMRAGLTDHPSFTAAGAALERNSRELESLVSRVYGRESGSAFGETWRAHVAYLVDYTRALANDDAAAQELAEQQLHDYAGELASLLASVNPNLAEASVEQLVDEHVQQLEAIAAFDSGDFDEAYPAIRDTYSHMFAIGDALSEAIALQFPQEFEGKSLAFSPAVDLRITLDRLIGEHTMLAVTVTRASLGGDADAQAAQAALASNTADLSSAVADIYGQDAGRAFDRLWKAHTDAYVRYVRGTVDDAPRARQAALDDLVAYRDDFSAFLANANPQLSAADLRSMLAHHTEQLIDQVDAFAAEDYDSAYAVTRDAFAHAFVMGDALSLAIAAQFPDRYPDVAQEAPAAGTGSGPIGAGLLLAALLLWLRQLRGRRRATSP